MKAIYFLMAVSLLLMQGCQFISVTVHQSSRLVDSNLGNNDEVLLNRGDDTTTNKDDVDLKQGL